MNALTPASIHSLTCSRCAFPQGRHKVLPSATDRLAMARTHETADPGHRVTVWGGPTSQLPRSFWTGDPAPEPSLPPVLTGQLAAALTVAEGICGDGDAHWFDVADNRAGTVYRVTVTRQPEEEGDRG